MPYNSADFEKSKADFFHEDHVKRQDAAELSYGYAEHLSNEDYQVLWNMVHHDVYQTVRIAAAKTLCLLKRDDVSDTARNTILNLVSYPGFKQPHRPGAEIVRIYAINALTIIKDHNPDTLVALTHAMKDDFEEVSSVAKAAIVTLSQFLITPSNKRDASTGMEAIPQKPIVTHMKTHAVPFSAHRYGRSEYNLLTLPLKVSTKGEDSLRRDRKKYHKNLTASLKMSHGDFVGRFELNYLASDKLYCDGKRKLMLNPIPREAFIISYADRITSHARRRIDLFFYTLVFFYRKTAGIDAEVRAAGTPLTHGIGGGQNTPLETEPAHDALIPAFRIVKNGFEFNPLEGAHFEQSLNMTTELPIAVNKFDTHFVEGHYDGSNKKMRYEAMPIVQWVAKGKLTPIQGLDAFLHCLYDHFDQMQHAYLGNPQAEGELDAKSRKVIFDSQKMGSFGYIDEQEIAHNRVTPIWHPQKGILLDYLYLLLRINKKEDREILNQTQEDHVFDSPLFEEYLIKMQKEIQESKALDEEESSIRCQELEQVVLATEVKEPQHSQGKISYSISNETLQDEAMKFLRNEKLIGRKEDKDRTTPNGKVKTPQKAVKIERLQNFRRNESQEIEIEGQAFQTTCLRIYEKTDANTAIDNMFKNQDILDQLRKAYEIDQNSQVSLEDQNQRLGPPMPCSPLYPPQFNVTPLDANRNNFSPVLFSSHNTANNQSPLRSTFVMPPSIRPPLVTGGNSSSPALFVPQQPSLAANNATLSAQTMGTRRANIPVFSPLKKP